MLKRLCLWLGAVLLIVALAMMIMERLAIHHLKQELNTYGSGDVIVEGARLYFDGLSVKRASISDELVLKNVLFGRKAIKHVEILEMTIPHESDFLEKPLPIGLYDHLNIKFVTLHLPFLEGHVSMNGRLQSKQKSDGSTGYVLNFNSQKGDIRAKGTATFELADQKISHMAVALEEGASRHDWLNAKRVTGWWDYKGDTGEKSGELTIGSLAWQGLVLNNAQLALTDKTITVSGDLLKDAGQVDGDITWENGAPQLSIAAKINDLSIYDDTLTGEGDFQVNLTLKESSIKTSDFIGEGDVKGRFKIKNTSIDFDYVGELKKQGDIVTVTPDDCFNASVSLTRQATLFNIPKKQCFTLATPIMLDGSRSQKPVQFKGEDVFYALKHGLFNKTVYGTMGNVSGRLSALNDISVQVKNASLNHDVIKTVSGDLHFGRNTLTHKTLNAHAIFQNQHYDLSLDNDLLTIKDKKTTQKIAELTGSVAEGRYTGKATFNGALSLLDPDASAGQAFYNGSIEFDIADPFEQITGIGVLKINEGAFKKGDLNVEGVSAQIQIQGLRPFLTKPNQTITIKKGTLGSIDFENANISISRQDSQQLTLHSSAFNAFGGTWQGQDTIIQSNNIPVSNILKDSVFEGLVTDPEEIDGRLSFKMNENGYVTFEAGIFKAPSTGKITYNDKRRPQLLNTGSDYYNLQRMRDILAHFEFSKLAVPFDKTGVQGIYILGTHPKYNKGKPIEFDLTVSNSN